MLELSNNKKMYMHKSKNMGGYADTCVFCNLNQTRSIATMNIMRITMTIIMTRIGDLHRTNAQAQDTYLDHTLQYDLLMRVIFTKQRLGYVLKNIIVKQQ